MADDVRTFELGARFGEDAGAVEGDIAVADDGGVGAAERRGEASEIRVAVVPAHERPRADYARQVLARDSELAVVRRAGGEDDRVVEARQVVDGEVAADGDIADEANGFGLRHLVVALRHRL